MAVDLPVCVTFGDIAAVAREGLLAMSVAAGMAVMQAMFDAEVEEIAGPRGKHDAERTAVRHGLCVPKTPSARPDLVLFAKGAMGVHHVRAR